MLVEYKCLLWNYLGAFKIHILPVSKILCYGKNVKSLLLLYII